MKKILEINDKILKILSKVLKFQQLKLMMILK